MSNYDDNINVLSDYFISGDKNTSIHTLGVEIEHFIVFNDTMEAVPYEGEIGISHILSLLCACYPDAKIKKGGPLLGFTTDKFSITIEPAAQLEISIYPFEDITTIKKVYMNFRDNLDDIIRPYGLCCVTYGYQPKSKVDELPLIPKKRYKYMDEYFKTSGTCGKNMMRGTASLQVSLDYYSEEDFRHKIQAAYLISPILKLLTDNCPVFEGEKNTKNIIRSYIWQNVDPKRAGIIPGVMNPDFGFSDYSEYLLKMPPIFIPNGDNDGKYTGDTPAYELIENDILTPSEIDHLLSMAFPDVRLKHYLEIRYADSLPEELAFSYIALLKGIFYNCEALSYLTSFISDNKITDEDILAALDNVTNHGWEANIYGYDINEILDTLIEYAYSFLPQAEKQYLEVWSNEL